MLLRELYEGPTVSAIVRDGDKILVGLSKHNDDRKGYWVFPGGHIKDDETVESGAARECFEETGIECDIRDTHKVGNHYYAVGRKLTDGLKPAEDEFMEVRWMPVQEFLEKEDSYDSDREFFKLHVKGKA